MNKKLKSFLKGTLVTAIAFTTVVSNTVLANAEVTFKTQKDGTYAGMPLFDGNPDHLDEYLDTYLDYVGLEGKVFYALGVRQHYTLKLDETENKGKTIIGGIQFTDAVQGIATDFPAMIALGQTWNTELVEEAAKIIGLEKIVTNKSYWESGDMSSINVNLTTPISDMRINPLSGRFDESISEDLKLTSDMVNALGVGASGIYEEGNEDGFWSRAIVTTKHYSNYAGQFFRHTASTDGSVRSIMEYHALSPVKAISNGSVSGVMSSYGRTNGIPNLISPLLKYVQEKSPWGKDGGIYNVNDYLGSQRMYSAGSYSNGVDNKYTPTFEQAVALGIVANAGGLGDQYQEPGTPSSGWSRPGDADALVKTLVELTKAGAYGLSAEEVEYNARAHLIPLIRCGVFNEKDENGYPIGYAFTDILKDDPSNYSSSQEAHKDAAYNAAKESIVLLKNENNVLPLDKDAPLSVVGPFSNTLFKTTYAVGSTPKVENAGLTAIQGIEAVAGNEDIIDHSDDVNRYVFKASNGKYLVLGSDGSTLYATAETAEEATKFDGYPIGQDNGYFFLSPDNNKWLQFNKNAIAVNGTQSLTATGVLSAGGYASTMPNRIRVHENDDGTVTLVVNAYGEGFTHLSPEKQYYNSGRLVKVDPETNVVTVTDTLKNKTNEAALTTADTKLTMEVVKETGSDAVSFIESNGSEYAVVVVGAPTRHSSGEGADRSDLYMGQDQYDLVEKVSKAYPGKTIVVISAAYPVIAEEIQNNKDVAAIVYQPYGGQYAGLVLGEVLYGDVNPSGKLTSTWYADMSAFRTYDEYTIPEGPNAEITFENLDPKYVYDMSTGDAQEAELTYMYTNAPVTYEFGYGLSYSDFEYGALSISQDGDSFKATVNVKNTGTVDGKEVVQLYVTNKDSAYGKYAPKLKLAAYEKVAIKAGDTVKVELTFDGSDIAIWDTNAGKLVLEEGTYLAQVGTSSEDIRAKKEIEVTGEVIGNLDATTEAVSVYDHSFASSHVTYRETSRQTTVDNLNNDEVVNGYYTVMGRNSGAWTAMKNVDVDRANSVTVSVGTLAKTGVLELRLDSPTGKKIATIAIDNSGINSYDIKATNDESANVAVNEVAYVDVTEEFDKDLEGVHDIYVVFKSTDMRINTIQFAKSEAPVDPDQPTTPDQPTNPDEPVVNPEKPTDPTNPDEPVVNPEKPTDTTRPETGDNTNIVLWTTLATATAACGLVAIKKRKKEEV